MPPSRLQSAVLPRVAVDDEQIERMYTLLAAHFEGTDRATFLKDLAEKEWVVLLRDPAGEIVGFSTLMILEAVVDGQQVRAFFSGDTIVHRDHWGDPALASVWGTFVLGQAGERPEARNYWFLISKGFRTYRFLPLYFKRFFPRHDEPTPAFERAVLDTLATLKFPGAYDPARGIIHFMGPKDRLRGDLAEVPEGREANPHVAFFLATNPGYVEGDELACLAELAPENITAAGQRVTRGRDRVAAS